MNYKYLFEFEIYSKYSIFIIYFINYEITYFE